MKFGSESILPHPNIKSVETQFITLEREKHCQVRVSGTFSVAQFWGSFKSKWEACVARQHVCLGHLLRRPMIGSPGTDAKL